MTDLTAWTDDRFVHALRRRRSVRAGVAQLIAVVLGLALGLLLPSMSTDQVVPSRAVEPLLLTLGGGLITFIALVYSLLFLVVQHASTTFTPRLTIFRDDPMVWRTFAAFVGVFVFLATCALRIGADDEVTVVVPILAIALVVVSLLLTRRLQMQAYSLVQLNATLNELRTRGETVIRKLYPNAITVRDGVELPSPIQTIHWERAPAVLRQLDLPLLYRLAGDHDAVVVIHSSVGDDVRRKAQVITVHGTTKIDPDRLLAAFDTGIDRTFDQDPLLAFRLLADIAVRALSPAVNDPATAIAALGHAYDLLTLIADRDLDVGVVRNRGGSARVVVNMPTWSRFVGEALDDVMFYGRTAPSVRSRLGVLLDELAAAVPIERAAEITTRRQQLNECKEPA